MKKIIIKSIIALSTIAVIPSLNSCKDALDIQEPGVLTDDVLFSSVSNLQDYLVGSVYGNLEPSYAMYLTAVLTDEVKPGIGSGGQEFQLHRFYLDSSDMYTQYIWQNNYTVINRVNRLLEGASKFTPSDADLPQYNKILGQARAIRAFCYVQLETYFSTNMADPNALGVLLSTNVAASDDKLPRSKNSEVYALIDSDLQFAYSNLTVGTDRYYADKRFVSALMARYNLYRGNYALAKQYAQEVLSTSGLVLTPAASYKSMWTDTIGGEIIFALNRLAASGSNGFSIGTYWNTNSSSYSGNPMWVWGRNLFNIMNTTPGDVRRTAYVDTTAHIDPNYATSSNPINTDVLVIDKYPGKTNGATRNDEKIFRLSEMYFILAECAVRQNDLTLAANYIQSVRVARGITAPAVTYATAKDAFADILKERRVELSLEGHRYIDLKRLAVDAGVSMDRNRTDDIVTVTNLENGSYKYTLPIPLNETSANPNAQQNPGY